MNRTAKSLHSQVSPFKEGCRCKTFACEAINEALMRQHMSICAPVRLQYCGLAWIEHLRLGCRSAVAAAVDGQDRITVLQVKNDGTLAKQQDLSIPGLALPTALQVL